MKHSAIFEVKAPGCVDAAELAGVLNGPGFLGVWEQEGELVLYWRGRGERVIPQVLMAFRQLHVKLAETDLQVQPVREQDWNAQWAASVMPIRIGRRIGIRPSWASMVMPEDGIELILDPKQAFGTGHHATTQLLLECLEEMNWSSCRRVLDVGTGSGILSMVALRLGATTALGIDVDEDAINCAKEYARENNFKEQLKFLCCRIQDVFTQSFEVILANIDCKTILHNYLEFSRMRCSQTALFLSGLLEEDESDVVDTLENHGWMRQRVKKRDGWIAIQFVVSSPDGSSSG